MNVVYPSEKTQEIIINEAKGAEPYDVYMVAPTVVKPNESFTLKIVVRDRNGFPSLEVDKTLEVMVNASEYHNIIVNFEKGKTAIAFIEGVSLKNVGFYRYECELNDKVYYSNPVKCTNKDEKKIYWGDPHIHSSIGDCHPDTCRTLTFAYKAAKYISALDFIAVTDHVSNDRCSLGKWKEEVLLCNLSNEPENFITLPAYEASLKGGLGGDNNVYLTKFPPIYIDGYEDKDIKGLCKEIDEKKEEWEFDYFVVPHHTTRANKHGEISEQIYPGDKRMPVIEIHSTWGTSEYRGNPTPLKKIHPGPSYTVDMLNRGLKFGFIAGTDSHRTMTFPLTINEKLSSDNQLPGVTAVFASNLSRQDIFNGIKNKNCYACVFERIYLNAILNNTETGQVIECYDNSMNVNFSIVAAAQSNITKIEVVKNGFTVHSEDIGDWKADFTYKEEAKKTDCLTDSKNNKFSYFYFRVTCESGAKAWSSPIWINFNK